MGTFRSRLAYRACAAGTEFGAKQLTSRLRDDHGRMFRQISTAAGSTTVADSVADKAPSSKHFCKWRSYYYDPPAGVSDLGERRRRLWRESTSGQSPDSCGEAAGAPQLTAAACPRHGGPRPMRAES